MYAKPVKKEWASEEQCYYPLEISKQLLDMVFNKQWGIFYYEPCSVGEAKLMIEKFEEKINELKEEYEIQKKNTNHNPLETQREVVI